MAIYIVGIYRENRLLCAVFRHSILVAFGVYAYTLHLTHMAALQLANTIAGTDIFALMLAVFLQRSCPSFYQNM
jgi:hypothetical protein